MIGFAHRIEVNIPAMELSLLENGFKIKTYQLAIGKKTHQTPEQESEIHFIEWNPSWYPPKYSYWAKDEQETPPGPDNPIGIAKLPLLDDILFHGTNDESSIGQASSHGCLRMKNQDITELAWFLQSRYSHQSQNWWPSIYKKNLHRTYVVKLDQKIPVTLKYETATIQNGKLKIYPDYYQKLTNKNTAAILAAFHKAKISLQSIDAEKVEEVANNWQTKEIKLADMMLTPDKPSLAPAPECS
jgi:murein L,D-transpeptidase YcbB/YkuD